MDFFFVVVYFHGGFGKGGFLWHGVSCLHDVTMKCEKVQKPGQKEHKQS